MAPASGPTITARRADVARLRAEGLTVTEIADELGCSFPTVARDVRALGLPSFSRRSGWKRGAVVACPKCGRERYRAPSEIHKRFCRECYLEDVSHSPPPTDRTCRHCGQPLSFEHPKDAVGRGFYCGWDCYLADQELPPRVAVSCPFCGTVRERPPSHAHKRFCSSQCWARYRLALGMLRHLVDHWGWPGDQTRIAKLKMSRGPGRSRSYTDEQAAWVLRLAALDYGHDRIAETVGLHRDTVRRIRCPEKRS
jgi:transposase/endogenous inhibitor of DNA gyrase (YacG/DUF329 family)